MSDVLDQLGDYLKQNWPAIREQLLNGTCEPKPVRGVEIPKPDAGVNHPIPHVRNARPPLPATRLRQPDPTDIVNSLVDISARLGIHLRTLQRMLADGTGPPIVHLSARRLGVLESDYLNWIAARRRPLAGEPKARRSRSSKLLGATP
jgi:predicted DNA-binding transcriptional regulator AlpA